MILLSPSDAQAAAVSSTMMPGVNAPAVVAAEAQGDGGLGVGKRQFTLQRESELRCEVDWESSLTVRLLSGTAEVFGTELPEGRPISFSGGEKIAVRHLPPSAPPSPFRSTFRRFLPPSPWSFLVQEIAGASMDSVAVLQGTFGCLRCCLRANASCE